MAACQVSNPGDCRFIPPPATIPPGGLTVTTNTGKFCFKPCLWKSCLKTGSHKGSSTLSTRNISCWLTFSQPESPSRSEEHTSELQSLMRISYAVFCLKKKNKQRATILNYPSINL